MKNNKKNAVIVGAGDLGKALLGYNGFTSYGLNVVAAFESDENLCGTYVKGKPIYHMNQMEDVMNKLDIHIGIITTPAKFAQTTCNNSSHASMPITTPHLASCWATAPINVAR